MDLYKHAVKGSFPESMGTLEVQSKNAGRVVQRMVLLLSVILLWSGCKERKESTKTCNVHSECPSHQICKGGTCIAWTCTENAQCVSPLRCVDGLCRDVDCFVDDECRDGKFCDNNSCIWPCELLSTCECLDANDCAGAFCAGPASCVLGECRTMGNPCALIGDSCNENINTCKPVTDTSCAGDEDCDDDLFCTGNPRCIDSICHRDGSPCSYDAPFCDEGQDICRNPSCVDDTDCDNETFCDGAEECVDGVCVSSDTYACAEDAPFCDPTLDTCTCMPGSQGCFLCYSADDCAAGESCTPEGECLDACGEKVCGDDGYGGSCGECDQGLDCTDGACVCVPECGEKVCGDDGCDGSCGECDASDTCVDGTCVCVPSCLDKTCGDDGCGGSCGECSTIYSCNGDGQCACDPALAANACASGYFADGAHLKMEDHGDWDFYLEDFTFESWIYFPVDWSTPGMIFYQSDGVGAEHRLQAWRCNTNELCFDYALGVSVANEKDYGISCSGTAPHSVWHHVALERFGEELSLYLNGTALTCAGNNSDAENNIGSLTDLEETIAGDFLIGSDGEGATQSLKAYLDELRLIKGEAFYKDDFSPDATPSALTPETALLLRFDAPTSAPGIIDIGWSGHSIEVLEDVTTSTSQTPFPCGAALSASAAFPHFNTQDSTALYGTSGNTQGPHLVVDPPEDEDTVLVFNNSDFTFEWNVRFATFDYTNNPNGSEKILIWSNTLGEVDQVFEFSIARTALVIDYVNTIRGTLTWNESLVADRWYHMALVYDKEESTFSFYVDGVLQGSLDEGVTAQGTTVPMPYMGTQDSQSPKTIGGGAGGASGWRNNLSGHLDDFRVSKIKRYAEDFSPSSHDFVADADTVLLLAMDGSNGGDSFVDSSSLGNVITVQGGVTASTQYDAWGANQCALFAE